MEGSAGYLFGQAPNRPVTAQLGTRGSELAAKKTHRKLAWGVLGSASGGFYRFSLLTLLFSGVC